jgi:nicotinate-nucleotide adenylyltransferase
MDRPRLGRSPALHFGSRSESAPSPFSLLPSPSFLFLQFSPFHWRGLRQNRAMKIGLMGGSFDPVHFGHLVAAQDAVEQHQLDRLIMVPAAQAPLKPADVQTSGEHRLAMLRAATDWDHRFEVSDLEIRRGGVSYTIDSARHFRNQFPQDDLYWIIGGDQLPKLHLWKEIEELARLVEFIFLERPGHAPKPAPAIPGLRLHRCDGHLIEISSTELRERVRQGRSLDYFVPHKAIVYIQENQLYR